MANPGSRAELKDYCLRNLGFPVVEINVDDDQLEDRIDEALQKFYEYAYDGVEELYLAHQVTANDITNKYITVPDIIIGVSRVLPLSSAQVSSGSTNGFNIFDINYQIRLNDFYNLTSSSYTYYVIARQHLAMLDLIVTGEIPMQFNKKTNHVYLTTNWSSRLNEGDYLVFEATKIIDPASYPKIFNDVWLKEYTTQLFKKQWGTNLTKYDNYVLPGGLTINGPKFYQDAVDEIARLEAVLRDTYEEPPRFIVA